MESLVDLSSPLSPSSRQTSLPTTPTTTTPNSTAHKRTVSSQSHHHHRRTLSKTLAQECPPSTSRAAPDNACLAEGGKRRGSTVVPDNEAESSGEESSAKDGNFPLGQPKLRVVFCSEENEDAIPPAFYPGQTIPTTLLFELPRYTSLPLALNPQLTMSLIGSLGLENAEPRPLINVGVSLEEGLKLWRKDATTAYERLSERKKKGRKDPAHGLPGGKYTLPLTVQVPTHPKLPPSFSLNTSFSISYQLEVILTIDNPEVEGERQVLVEDCRSFSLLPTTLPTPAPELPVLSHTIITSSISTPTFSSDGWMDKLASAGRTLSHFTRPGSTKDDTKQTWTVVPSLPTTTFSPSSKIPLSLNILPPANAPPCELYIRAVIVRREHVFASMSAPTAADEDRGMINEEEIVSRWGWVGCSDKSQTILPDLDLPVGFGLGSQPWTKGFTTSLTVSPDPTDTSSSGIHTHCSSRFFISLEVGFSSQSILPHLQALHYDIPSWGQWSTPLANGTSHGPSRKEFSARFPGKVRSIMIPIAIGSVNEPEGARHRRSWRELYLEPTGVEGETRGRMVSGTTDDSEDGWILAPPSYQTSLITPPYVL